MNDTAAHASIDALTGRFYSVFDNRSGRVPELAELCALFAPRAVIATHSGAGPVINTVDDFGRPRIELLRSGRLLDFHEWETGAETQVLGTLAARRSRYAKRGQMEGRPYAGAGTKFFQLALLESAWRIVALSWIDDA